jgi:hypothetical protein
MSEGKREIKEIRKIKETFVGAAQAAYDATNQLTSMKQERSTEKKK